MVATFRSTSRSRQFVKQLVAVQFFSWNLLFLRRHSMGNESRLRSVAETARSSLRVGDLVFRLDEHEIVCVLHGADAMTAHLVLLRVADALEDVFSNELPNTVRLGIASATPPIDGLTVDELVASARQRMKLVGSELITSHPPI